MNCFSVGYLIQRGSPGLLRVCLSVHVFLHIRLSGWLREREKGRGLIGLIGCQIPKTWLSNHIRSNQPSAN